MTSKRMLREFWENPKHAKAKGVLLEWFKNVTAANWRNFADVKKTYNTSDQVGHKVVFDVGGNDYRGIAFIDYEAQRVYVRAVLDHKEYDKGNWKYDSFGDKWKPFKEMIQNRNGKSA